jgi:hypothetical protein
VRGKNERDALRVLARLIEDDRLTPRLRYRLAGLVNPRGNSERKIAFKFRRSGNRSSHERDFDIQTTFIDGYVRRGILPRPIRIGDLVRWRWVDVEKAIQSLEAGDNSHADHDDPYTAGIERGTTEEASY